MAKSDSYQYKIIEISLEPAKLNNFSNDSGMYQSMASNSNPFEIIELRQSLLDELYKIINGDFLTAHQKKILTMILSGATQNEVAEELGITQSAIHKSLSGNIDYRNNKKRYGGIVKKLIKATRSNTKIQEILTRINKIRNNEESE